MNTMNELGSLWKGFRESWYFMNGSSKVFFLLLVIMLMVGSFRLLSPRHSGPRKEDLTPIAASVPRKECEGRGGIPYDVTGQYLTCF